MRMQKHCPTRVTAVKYNMVEARNQLPKLVQASLAGEDVVISRKGIPVVRLVKIITPGTTRKPGAWAGLPKAEADWDSPDINADITDTLGVQRRAQ